MRLAFGVLAALLISAPALAQDGGALYARHCAACHDAGIPRTPARRVLAGLTPERILAALESGSMREQGAQRTAAERRAIAAFLTGTSVGDTPAPPPLRRCAEPRPMTSGAAWNGWGLSAANDRFQPDPGLDTAEVPRLALKWAFAFPGDTSAAVQPSIVGGRVFVASVTGRVYALDLQTGCAIWTFDADGQVRTAIEVGEAGGAATAVFGDVTGTVYAVHAGTGALRWKQRVDAHPAARITGSPTLHGGRVFVGVSSIEEVLAADPRYPCCTFRGSVVALDAASGTIAWKTFLIPEAPQPTRRNSTGTQMFAPSGAAVWSSPTIDPQAGAVYVTTGDSYSAPAAATSDAVIALDLDDGAIRWTRQTTTGDVYNLACNIPDGANCPGTAGPDVDFGGPPILVALGQRRVLVAAQKSAEVHALDPDDRGRVLWTRRLGRGGALGGIEWGAAADRRHVYVALSDVAFAPPAPGAPGLTLDPRAGGGLFALRLEDGADVWHASPAGCGNRTPCSPAQSAPPSVAGGVVFSGSLDGHLRAYAIGDGRVVWDFDTAREFTTVNGATARGGSIDVGGPAIAAGIVLTTSGYPQWGGMGGNVLLAFSVDGR